MAVIQPPFTSLVKDKVRYMLDNNSFLGTNPSPFEVVGNFTVFSVLVLNVSVRGSVLIAHGMGSEFTTTSLIKIWQEQ
jgi:hypothetical protein